MQDQSERFLTEDLALRVTVVVLTDAVETARQRHSASAVAAVAMGRAMLGGALLATTVRERGRINLQVVGQGPLGALAVDAHQDGRIRAYVRRPLLPLAVRVAGRTSVAGAVGRTGEIHVLTEGQGGQYSRGTAELVSGEVDEDVDHYMRTSLQIQSFTAAEVVLDDADKVTLAAGVLVEALPGGDAARVDAVRARLEHGGFLKALTDKGPTELQGLADLVMDGLVLRAMQGTPWKWFCPCSRDRVMAALSTLGEPTLREMIRDEGGADADCDFCRQHYKITADELTSLADEMLAASGRQGGSGGEQ